MTKRERRAQSAERSHHKKLALRTHHSARTVLLAKRLAQLYEMVGPRDLIEIAVLAVVIYGLLRFLGKTRGPILVRGLALVVVGLFLLTQVIIASFDLTAITDPREGTMQIAASTREPK